MLLDTHAFVWWVVNDPRLSPRAQAAIKNSSEICYVSAVSAFEIANKVRIGKFPAAAEIEQNLIQLLSGNSFLSLPVTIEHSLLAGRLDGVHRDPFDRLLAAQSLTENIPLVTRDAEFRMFGVETVW